MVELAKQDAVIVTGGDNGFNHIIAQPEIKSLADLRGTTVVVDAPNTAFALLLYKALKNSGLNKGDYKVSSVGGTGQRLDAMKKDKANASAGVVGLPFLFLATAAGFKDMGAATELIGAYQSDCAIVMRDWAKANGDTLVRYIKATVEGRRWVLDPANKAEATQLLVDRLKLSPDFAARSYAIVTAPVGGMAKDAKFDLEGFKNVLKLRAEIEGQWGGHPPAPDRYFDLSYYDKALAAL
jgi:ABC-type nitrate/sulfonate/bicarbonate transport system substrate-binding protein